MSKSKRGLQSLIQSKNKKKRWSSTEKEFVKKHSCDMSDDVMAETLKKTVKSIREMRYRLNLIKKSGRGIVELRD